jgi:hypothetical protein
MKSFRLFAFAAALLTASASLTTSAKNIQVPKAYMFGFVASFNDSIVYFTDIQTVDSVWVSSKKNLLAGGNHYSYQLRDHFAQQMNMPYRTCIVVSSLKRKDVEKKLQKMKQDYMVKNKGKYDVRFLTESDFRFQTVNMAPDEQVAPQPKQKKEKKPKDASKRPPRDGKMPPPPKQ